MIRQWKVVGLLGGLMMAAGLAAEAAPEPMTTVSCASSPGDARGNADSVSAAAQALHQRLNATERAALERPFTRANAILWSNLPVGIVQRKGLRLGDLDAEKSAAARRLVEAALSACGMALFDEIRLADDVLALVDARKIGWSGANYYLSVLGHPSARTPWMLQIGGHHLAYNFTFNGREPGATPLFFGTEPIRFENGGKVHEPLSVQSASMGRLATALDAHPEARLSGTFTDVVKGVVVVDVPGKMPSGGIDSGFPQSYPTGAEDRGIRYDALTRDEQSLVQQAIESYTSLPGEAIARPLAAAYEAPEALAQTYVGLAGSPRLDARGSYVRIDGPRLWMEFVVQPAVAEPKELHYHALWRDKQSDYGGEARP